MGSEGDSFLPRGVEEWGGLVESKGEKVEFEGHCRREEIKLWVDWLQSIWLTKVEGFEEEMFV